MGRCASVGCGREVGIGWNRCDEHVRELLAGLSFPVLSDAERWELARYVQSQREGKDRVRAERRRRQKAGEFLDAFTFTDP